MVVELFPLRPSDVAAHNTGEDEETIRWLTGGYGNVESTTAHFHQLARNAKTGRGCRGFGVWADEHLAGYVDCNPDVRDGLADGDVSISYAIHPWARGRGVAVEAVHLICDYIRNNGIGLQAAIRVEPANHASVGVAQKAGFTYVHDFTSTIDRQPDGTPATLSLYVLQL